MNTSSQEQVWRVGKWVGIALVAFLALLSVKELFSLKYIGRDVPIMKSISVSGKGEAIGTPDIATFSFTVKETAKTVKEAQDKATVKTNHALDAIKKGGVKEKDIKTLSYNIAPHYEYSQGVCNQYGCPGGKSTITGYDVSQSIQVKIRDLAKAGELFDTIGTAGVTNVDGLTFTIDTIDDVKALARTLAIKNAEAKAKVIADELGVRLGRVVAFYDSSDGNGPYPMIEGALGGDLMSIKAQATPSVPVGEQNVIVNVSVTYEIK